MQRGPQGPRCCFRRTGAAPAAKHVGFPCAEEKAIWQCRRLDFPVPAPFPASCLEALPPLMRGYGRSNTRRSLPTLRASTTSNGTACAMCSMPRPASSGRAPSPINSGAM